MAPPPSHTLSKLSLGLGAGLCASYIRHPTTCCAVTSSAGTSAHALLFSPQPRLETQNTSLSRGRCMRVVP